MATARSGREATVDFYHACASAMHALSYRNGLGIDPILRVHLTTGLLAALLDQAAAVAAGLPPELQ